LHGDDAPASCGRGKPVAAVMVSTAALPICRPIRPANNRSTRPPTIRKRRISTRRTHPTPRNPWWNPSPATQLSHQYPRRVIKSRQRSSVITRRVTLHRSRFSYQPQPNTLDLDSPLNGGQALGLPTGQGDQISGREPSTATKSVREGSRFTNMLGRDHCRACQRTCFACISAPGVSPECEPKVTGRGWQH
jgi:hypothetical protein